MPYVEISILNYKGYRVTDEYGNTYQISDCDNKVIRFTVPANFSGKIVIEFIELWYWRLGELVSVACIILLGAGWWRRNKRHYVRAL